MPSSASTAAESAKALDDIQSLLTTYGLSAYIVPTADSHQSEYVADCDMRRAFLTQFDGSAGSAVVFSKESAIKSRLWTDGRYFLQAANQLDSSRWDLMKAGTADCPPIDEFLAKNLPAGSSVGIDPRTASVAQIKQYKSTFKSDIKLVTLRQNLVDQVWGSRPQRPLKAAFPLEDRYTGVTSVDKLARIRKAMADKSVSAFVVTTLDEVAWLLNLRGSDIDFNPVFFAYVLVTADKVVFFIEPEKVSDAVRQHLSNIPNLEYRPYEAVFETLETEIRPSLSSKAKVWLDSGKVNYAIYEIFQADTIYEAESPITILKALKNLVEQEGMRQSHIRDAAAVCNFLCWLEQEVKTNNSLNECSIADKLEAFRAEQKDFMGLSFATIAGSGANGAIIHYRAEEKTAAPVNTERLLLLDSGAQYRDGTTDITRTLHLGQPTDFQKYAFTQVLKGHIALARAVFPAGTEGPKLDILARSALWRCGLEYNHGTGHGVGAFLNVHEGPQSISGRMGFSVPLQVGMCVSNEPGYYHSGEFGIRIESVVLVREADTPHRFENRKFLELETLTLVPIQAKMIDLKHFNEEELEWLNQFHAVVREKILPLVRPETKDWLLKNTEAIKKH